MGLYNVVEPCMVGDLHYARPTTEPIEVDDDVAKPLVKAGSLTSAVEVPELNWPSDGQVADLEPSPEIEQALAAIPVPKSPRRPRHTEG